MPPLVAGVVAAAGLTGAAATVATAAINAGVAIGLSYVARSLQGAPATDRGIKTTVSFGGEEPRGWVAGRAGLAGQFAYWNTAATDNNLLQQVFIIGEGPHEDLEAVWVNGKKRNLTLVSEDSYKKTYSVAGFVNAASQPILYVDFWFGYSDQPASSALDDNAKPPSRWTSSDRLAGMCYVVVRAAYLESAFDSGIPRFLFSVKGRKLYDWRLDSTNGGSGTHRWNDETTWEFSENPIVQLYSFMRGTYLGGEVVVGMGVPPADLVLDLFTAAANVCDEYVTLDAGGSERRYRCGTYISASEEHGQIIERLLESCAGSLYERAGLFGPIAGIGQTVVYPTITDADLVSGQPVKFTAKRSRGELVNGIFGSFASSDDQWELISYAARTDSAAETSDTEIRRVQVDYPQVSSQTQAQRLAQIALNLSRLQATTTITLGLSAIVLEPGDWVRWNSARYGDRTYIILSLTQNTDQTVTLNLREVASSAYGWSTADEEAAPAAGEEAEAGAQVNGVSSFSLSPVTLTGAGGVKTPAVRVYWTPITDTTVTAILLEYRVQGEMDALAARFDVPSNGEWLIASGLQAATTYEMRATIETVPARDTVWTSWTTVTTGEHVVASVAPSSITPEQFTAALNDKVLTRAQADRDAIKASIDDLALAIADVDAAQDTNRQNLSRAISVQVGAARASFSEQITVVATETGALASQVTALEASFEDIGASLNCSFEVAATPAGATAAYQLTANAEGVSAGLYVVAYSGDSASSYVAVEGAKFYVLASDGSKTPIFTVDTMAATVYLNGDMVASGSITAGHLSVATLSSITGNVGTLTAGLIKSADDRLRIDLDNVRITFQSIAS